MIKEMQDYISSIYENMTYGQIQDSPDNLYNINMYNSNSKPFFSDDNTHTLTINLFIRDTSFETMQANNENVSNSLCNIYDKDISNYHIVNTKMTSSNEPSRDDKNRYSITSTFEMLIEEV